MTGPDALSDIDDIYWFGYVVAWIGVLAYVGGALTAVWITIYAFGVLVALIDTLVCYYYDYFYVCTKPPTEER